MSPVILGFGALDAMIAAQAAYAVRDLHRKSRKRKNIGLSAAAEALGIQPDS